MNGRDSYGVPRGFCGDLFGGFLPQPPYFSGERRRGLTFGLSARRSFGREEYIPCPRERQSLTPPRRPGLALTMGSVVQNALGLGGIFAAGESRRRPQLRTHHFGVRAGRNLWRRGRRTRFFRKRLAFHEQFHFVGVDDLPFEERLRDAL